MEKCKEMVKKAYGWICKGEVFVCAVFFVIIIALVFFAAILRKMSMPIQWTSDVAQLLFAWLAFLGADVALRQGSLVGVGLVTGKLPPKLKRAVALICYVLMFAFLVIIIRYGFPLAARNWKRAFQSLSISYSWVTLSLPVSAILMLLSIVHNVLVLFKEPEQPQSVSCSCAGTTKEA